MKGAGAHGESPARRGSGWLIALVAGLAGGFAAGLFPKSNAEATEASHTADAGSLLAQRQLSDQVEALRAELARRDAAPPPAPPEPLTPQADATLARSLEQLAAAVHELAERERAVQPATAAWRTVPEPAAAATQATARQELYDS